MSIFSNINLEDYNYHLPNDKIADFPRNNRLDSKLLYSDLSNQSISHYTFSSLNELIPQNSLLILNSTKVIMARLYMKKPSGGKIELLLIEPLSPSIDPAIIMSNHEKCIWKCMIGGKKVKEGLTLEYLNDNIYDFKAEVLKKYDNYGEIQFTWNEKYSFSQILTELGKLPLPPYLEREAEESDKYRYQTVYAKSDGSVAAPTAGLHFTEELINSMKFKGIKFSQLILHVGPGTFLPVSSDNLSNHIMHEERCIISQSTILAIYENLKFNRNIIAVGTTSVRTLETIYWIGLKKYYGLIDSIDDFELFQTEPYELTEKFDVVNPLIIFELVSEFMEQENLPYISGKTSLFIVPGYNFKIINGLITNYHLPKSTLVLLVAALTSHKHWKDIYNSALDNDYKFLSYGDSSFLFLPKINN